MLKHPTLDGLQTLKLSGMVAALADQMATPDIDELAFEERLGLLVDREITERENRRLTSRLRRARLRHAAALEDIDYRNPRGLDKGLIQSLATCQWAKEHLNILIIGPTGVGKTAYVHHLLEALPMSEWAPPIAMAFSATTSAQATSSIFLVSNRRAITF